MKLAVLVAAAARAKNSSWLKKEWEVQNAYFADEEIILSDPSIRDSSKRNNEKFTGKTDPYSESS